MNQNKFLKAYAAVEHEFTDDYLFQRNECAFFDNVESAREDIELFKEENELSYIVEVSIKNNLFNIYCLEHRSRFYNALPKTINIDKSNINKDSLICFLMGDLNRDYSEIEVDTDTDYLFSLPIKNIIKDLGYNGFIARFEELSKYVVFEPDENKNVQVEKIFL
jgi:hypothetical protein